MIERHYSASEIARLLGVNRSTITRRIQDGDLEAVSFGARLLVPESAIQRVLDAGRINAPGQRIRGLVGR